MSVKNLLFASAAALHKDHHVLLMEVPWNLKNVKMQEPKDHTGTFWFFFLNEYLQDWIISEY